MTKSPVTFYINNSTCASYLLATIIDFSDTNPRFYFFMDVYIIKNWTPFSLECSLLYYVWPSWKFTSGKIFCSRRKSNEHYCLERSNRCIHKTFLLFSQWVYTWTEVYYIDFWSLKTLSSYRFQKSTFYILYDLR